MTENEAMVSGKSLYENLTSNANNIIPTKEYIEFVGMAIQSLEEIQEYRAIGLSPNKIYERIGGLVVELEKYYSIGTVEEFKALKEQDHDCIIKHLSGECSYKETGCSDCKSKWKIKDLLEKNEPKKVIGIKSNLQNRYCPSCNEWAVFELKKDMKYCPNCGQKLDWSE